MEALFEAARDLEQEKAQGDIRAAYKDEGEGKNNFNAGILCCIPKGDGQADPVLGHVLCTRRRRHARSHLSTFRIA